jgi:glycosyltransferase involved in cell wall biosynthesis
LALKKFIISSNCPTGPREILNNGKSGILFKTADEYDLAKKINFYFLNRKKLKRKINHGYNQLARFDYNKNLNKYLNVVNLGLTK